MDHDYTFTLTLTLETSWLKIEPIYLGSVPIGLGTPDFYGLIEKDGEPYLCLNIYGDSSHSYNIARTIIWESWAVIIYADLLCLVSLDTKVVHQFEEDWLFCEIYPQVDKLLVTSDDSVYCFDTDANLLWKTTGLGIAGVFVDKVENNFVFGQGLSELPIDENEEKEFSRPFKLDLKTGKKL